MEIPMTVKPLIPSHSGKAIYVIVWGGGHGIRSRVLHAFWLKGGGGNAPPLAF